MINNATDGGSIEKMDMARSECKPDYEKMITGAKDKLEKNQKLQEAIFNYFGNLRLRNQMAELVGELVSEERQYRHEVARLIQQQENDTRE